MAASTPSLTDSHAVPVWVEKNAQLFRACPPGVRKSGGGTASNIRAGLIKSEEEEYAAASMAAMLINTEKEAGWIEAPAGLQPPSYFRDVSNHPNILATLVYSARRKAGFFPSLMGQQLSQEQWKDYINKFNAWLNELDAFWFYIPLISDDAENLPNSPATSDAVVDALSTFVLKTANEIEDGAKEELTERIKTTFELAAEYMVEKTSTATQGVTVAFQHEAFPPVGASNPSVPISFTTTTLSQSKQNSIQYGSATINRFIFRLSSANIIANAESLSNGSTMLSTKDYVDYINGPLDQWSANTNK